MKTKIFLVVILIFFLITRLYKISDIPSSLYWDEASIGYNAYSILKTGKDEWGEFLPIHFKAFGEYKLPVYIYSVSLAELLFGINAFSVRFPAVIFSLFILIFLFLITKKIYQNKTVGLIGTFLLSISPWFFIFSRTGYEATAGLMFFLLGFYLALIALKKNIYIFPMMLSFILAVYSYNAYRIIVPLTIIPFIFIYLRNSFIRKRIIFAVVSVLIFIISLIPIYHLYRYENGSARYQTISIISANNSYFDTGKTFIKNYFSHFSPNFLLKGDTNLRSQQSGFGQIYILDISFIIIGLFFIIKRHRLLELLPIFVIAVSIIPAAITNEAPHALRALSSVPFLMMIIGFGIYKLATILKYQFLVISLAIFIYVLFFLNYFFNFLIKFPEISASAWQYPYNYIFQNETHKFKEYKSIFVTDVYGQPYIFYLFSNQPNVNSIKLNSPEEWGNSKVSSISNVHFQKITNDLIKDKSRILIFSSPQDKLNINPTRVLKDYLGKEVLYVYEIK